MADVARRWDVATSLIYTWRRKALEPSAGVTPQEVPEPGFAEAVVLDEAARASSNAAPAIVIDLARGRRISIFASASPARVAAALKVLR